MKITLNKDSKIVSKIQLLLKQSGGYCPCSFIKNEDTKCMCKDFKEQQDEGFCHCELYYKSKV